MLLFFTATGFLYSQNISLDLSFGTNGSQNSLYNNGYINCSAMLSNGQILIAGTANADNRFHVAKHNINGGFDTSFGTNGYFFFNSVPNQKEWIYFIKALPDNKFIVAGKSDVDTSLAGFYYNAFIAKFNSNGTKDITFGTNGFVKTNLGSNEDNINSFVFTNTGEIYAVAHSFNTTSNQNISFLIKYNASGLLDTTFGSNGIMEIVLPNSNSLNTIAIQSNDKILLSGNMTNSASNNDILLVRLNLDGSFDTTFGTNGIVTTDFNSINESSNDLVIDSNNKITVIGTASGTSYLARFAVAQYNSDGSLNTSFNSTGKLLITNNVSGFTTSFGKKIKILPDNSLLFSGHSIGNNNYDLVLMKYNSNGTPVTGFGNNGQFLYQNSALQEFSNDVHLQSDGKVVVSGLKTSASNTTPLSFLIRYKDAFLDSQSFEDKKGFSIYPNPVENFLNIETDEIIENITINNLTGKIIMVIDHTKIVSTEKLNSGVYIIKLTTPSGVSFNKFIKK